MAGRTIRFRDPVTREVWRCPATIVAVRMALNFGWVPAELSDEQAVEEILHG